MNSAHQKSSLQGSDLLLIALGLVFLVGSFFLSFSYISHGQKNKASHLIWDMKSLGYQVGTYYISSQSKKSSRSPSSVGPVFQKEGYIGKDPWGESFIYKIEGENISLISLGPDKKKSTDFFSPKPQGDDFIISLEINSYSQK